MPLRAERAMSVVALAPLFCLPRLKAAQARGSALLAWEERLSFPALGVGCGAAVGLAQKRTNSHFLDGRW